MSSINIYKVATHLEENGWTLLSTEYKNLQTPLDMMCPNKHKQQQTYGEWRKYMNCDICLAGNTPEAKLENLPKKQKNTYRVLGLDAATVISGYSIFDNNELIAYGTHKENKNLSLDIRINNTKKWLKKVIQSINPDFIEIENIQLQSYGEKNNLTQVKTFQSLARLQGVLIDLLLEEQISYDLVYSSEWRKYLGVMGEKRDAKKKEAQAKVKMWYKIECTDDEADAICIGKYGLNKVKNSIHNSWGESI